MDNRQLAVQELAKRELARRELKRRQSNMSMQPVEPSHLAEDFVNRTDAGAFPGEVPIRNTYMSGKRPMPTGSSFTDVRMGAPETVADVTATPSVLPQIKRQQDRTVPSSQPEFVSKDFQSVLQEPPLDRVQNIKDFAGGVALGALPFEVEPRPFGSIASRLAYNLQNRPAADVGKFAGSILPITGAYGASEKVLGKAIAPLSKAAQSVVRGAGAGAILEGAKQVGSGEFDPEAIGESAATFGAFDLAGLGLGAGVKAVRGKKAELPPTVKPQGKTVESPAMTPEEVSTLAGQDVPIAKRLANMKEQGLSLEKAKQEVTGEAQAARNDRAQSMVTGSVAGSAAGFERDDEGNISYDPIKGLAGTALGIAALRGMKGEKVKPKLERSASVPLPTNETVMKMNTLKQPANVLSEVFGKSLENPIRTFEKLGEGAKEGFYRPVVNADHNIAVGHQVIADALNKTIKEANLPIFGRTKASQRIYDYAVSLQPNGKETLLAQGVKEIPKLTDGEMKSYEYMRSVFDDLFPKLNEARIKAGAPPFPKVKDYFTFMRNFDDALERGHSLESIPLREVSEKFVPIDKTPFRFAKKREDSVRPFVRDAFGNFDKYVQSALKHIEYTPILSSFKKVIAQRHGEFSLAEQNPAAYQFLTNWTNDLAGIKKPSNFPYLENAARKLNRNLAYSTMAYSLQSTAIQPTAYLNTWSELGSRYALEGIYKNMSSEARNTALAKSKVLLNREYDIVVKDALNSISSVKRNVAEKGLWGLKLLDMETARSTWWGAYQKATKQLKMSEDMAVNYADDIVTKTQGSAARRDLSPLQRTELGKAITLFQTFTINNWGFLTRDLLGKNVQNMSKTEKAGRVFRLLVGMQAINSVYSDVFGLNSPVPNPVGAYRETLKKKPDNKGGALGNAALEFGTLIPVVGGGTRYGSSPFGATVQLVSDVSKNINQAAQGKPNLKALSKLAMQGAGVPGTNQLFRIISAQNERVKPKKQSSPFGGFGSFGEMKGFGK